MTRGVKRDKEHIDTIIQLAIYVYMLNSLCKYFLPNIVTKLLPIIAVFLAAIRTESPFRLRVTKVDEPFVIFSIVWLIGCLYSPAITKGFGYVFSFALALVFGIYIEKKNLGENNIMKLITIVCMILAVFLIIQPISPEIVSQINHLFSYEADEYAVMQAWTTNGWYSGLFPDRAPAAFYCCILVGAGLYYIYANYKKSGTLFQRLFGIIFALVGIYGILLTAKRGLLVGAFIAAFATYVVYRKSNNASIWKICIAVIGIAAVVWQVFSNVEATQIMLSRFFDNDNILTGRSEIYSNIFSNIWSSSIIGTGTASAFSLLGVGGHNIYLTVLMENGIIGFLIFVFALINCLYCTVVTALKLGRNNYRRGIPFLMFSLYIQVFFIVYGMSGNPLYDNYILYFYLFAVLIEKNSEYKFVKRINEEK